MKHHISRVLEPIQSFFRHEAFSGLLLLFFAALAIILANSPRAAIKLCLTLFPSQGLRRIISI